MGKITNRVSLQDIAKATGVHVSTASLALRDDPRLTPATIQKVKDAAAKLGYRANPLVSAWLRQVRQPEVAQAGTGLAFVLGTEVNKHVAAEPYYKILVDGAREEARALGYLITEIPFGLNEENRLLKAVARLRYCGVRGVLIFDPEENLPAAVVRELESDFAVVVLLRCGGAHRFHRVGTDIIANVTLALGRLREMGCRRIALPIHPSQAQRVRKDALAAYLWQQQQWPKRERFPLPTEAIEFTPELFIAWMEEQRPDALLSVNYNLHTILKSAGWRMPEDLIFAHLGTDARPELMGINNCGFEVGRAAIFKLAGLVTGNRFGAPNIPLNTLVGGVWREAAPAAVSSIGRKAKTRNPG
ncbi:MAG: LacI family DNA-binding transcriptional regulator [Burkholderiales bacterium]|nr:LacI family DNA-binding transcriptional regulator [Opitutaceae bacterium]